MLKIRRPLGRLIFNMGIAIPGKTVFLIETAPWAPSQYPKRRLIVRSREFSKPWDLYLELSDGSEIWQALRQLCYWCACHISKRYDNLKYQSRGFETSQDFTKGRLFGYWDGPRIRTMTSQEPTFQHTVYPVIQIHRTFHSEIRTATRSIKSGISNS